MNDVLAVGIVKGVINGMTSYNSCGAQGVLPSLTNQGRVGREPQWATLLQLLLFNNYYIPCPLPQVRGRR